jgi:signal transduction histidine kinase/ligand-binding sensor domain-containing protein
MNVDDSPGEPSSSRCRRPHWLPLLALLACIAIPATAQAQAQDSGIHEQGHLLIRNFAPRDYQGHAQNWAIVQDHRGVMYVANGSGVLEYDGVRWRSIETTARSAVRTLAVGPDGTVYVGSSGDFGRLAPDSSGAMQYRSLVPGGRMLREEFTDIWRIVVADDGVYFSSRERLVRLDPAGDLHIWEPEWSFALGFELNGTFYTVDQRNGLVRAVGDRLEPAPGGESFDHDIVYDSITLDDGSAILVTRDRGLMRYDGTQLSAFPTSDDARLQAGEQYNATLLADGTFVVGTRMAGAFHFAPDGTLLRVINESQGLRDEQVWSSFTDRDGGVWLALNSGLARVEVNTPISVFGEAAGLTGIVAGIKRHQGEIHVTTSTGIFRMSTPAGDAPRFEKLFADSSGRCIELISTGDTLLAGCEHGLFSVRGEAASRVGLFNTRQFYRSIHDPGVLFAGARDALLVLREGDDGWTIERSVPSAPGWVLAMHEDASGSLWMTTAAEGVLRIDDPLADEPTITRYDESDGLPRGWAGLLTIDDRLVMNSTEGLWVIDPAHPDGPFIRETELSALLDESAMPIFLIGEDAGGDVWLTHGRPLRVIRQRGTADASVIDIPFLPEINAFSILTDDPDGTVWLGTDEGLFRIEAGAKEPLETIAETLIRGVTTGEDGAPLLADASGAATRLPRADNRIRFSLALPAFDGSEPPRFQVYLEGFDRNWSDWSAETARVYTNLPSGTYTLHARGRDGYGRVGDVATFTFVVPRAWYETWWARALFALALLALMAGAAAVASRVRNRRLQAHARRLEDEVAQRTATLELANERLKRVLAQNNEFMSIAAHDLKNPLVGILGFSEILLDEAAPGSEMEELLGLIHKSARQMDATLCQLHDTEALETGRIRLDLAPLDLGAVTADVLRRNEVQAEAKSITLRLHAPERSFALADEQYFPRVLDNLISNAVKFSSIGGAVDVELTGDGGWLEIRVADQGPGLTAEDKERVFGKLQRLSARPTGGETSSGLGLYIVDTLVRLHGGSVHVESEPGHGATFIVRLPAAEDPAGAAGRSVSHAMA